MVEEFADINRAMEKTGTFTMQRKKLFQLVGKANSNLADIILKVGLFDRSEIAWREAKYAEINEYLREEYEVTQRFGNLDIKLKFVEHKCITSISCKKSCRIGDQIFWSGANIPEAERNEQGIANLYASMRTERNQIYSKITELEMEVSEHSLVMNAIQPLDPSRRCYRMIGGVLVERTIKEVLPAMKDDSNKKEGNAQAVLVGPAGAAES